MIVLSIFWRRFNTAGAVAGLAVGLLSSIGLILISPAALGPAALFPLENPGLISIPLGFLSAVAGTLLSRDTQSQDKYTELIVRANTGLGAEKPVAH